VHDYDAHNAVERSIEQDFTRDSLRREEHGLHVELAPGELARLHRVPRERPGVRLRDGGRARREQAGVGVVEQIARLAGGPPAHIGAVGVDHIIPEEPLSPARFVERRAELGRDGRVAGVAGLLRPFNGLIVMGERLDLAPLEGGDLCEDEQVFMAEAIRAALG
jgi:hypothetical protein